MTLVVLIGPQAVGKMTVGQALEEKTDLRLFHNHMTIELVQPFLSYGTPEGRALVAKIRRDIFEAVAKSDQAGMIFTYVWAFGEPGEAAYIEGLADIFAKAGRRVCWVELEADLETRLVRNKTPNRLAQKPSKRDVAASEAELRKSAARYRLNSAPGELEVSDYMRIDTTDASPEAAAQQIMDQFGL